MSKGLKVVEELRKNIETHGWLEQQFEKEWLNTIEQELQALEIIKKLPDKYKEGLIYILLNALSERKISQEEYDSLKEVLEQ